MPGDQDTQREIMVLRTGEHVTFLETLNEGRVLFCRDSDGRDLFITPQQVERRIGVKKC